MEKYARSANPPFSHTIVYKMSLIDLAISENKIKSVSKNERCPLVPVSLAIIIIVFFLKQDSFQKKGGK